MRHQLRPVGVRLGLLTVLAGTSSAATFTVSVNGSSTQDLSGFGDPGPSSEQVSVTSNVGGANPSGTIVAQTYTSGDVSSLTTFHGDVSQGCVLVQGNQAAVIGKLPSGEQYQFGSPGHTHTVEWVEAAIQDNGASGDLSATGVLSVNDATGDDLGADYCNGTKPFSDLTAFLVPAAPGDYSFSYGDTLDNNPEKHDVNLTIVDSAGLPVTVTDATDPAGLDVTVGGSSGTVVLDTCGGYPVDLDAGSELVVSCGSVILQVIHGAAEVVLGGGVTTISVPQGGAAEVGGDQASGFTVQNLVSTNVGIDVNGIESTVAPGQTAPVPSATRAWFSPCSIGTASNAMTVGSRTVLS